MSRILRPAAQVAAFLTLAPLWYEFQGAGVTPSEKRDTGAWWPAIALPTMGLLPLVALLFAPWAGQAEACRCQNQSFAWQGCRTDAAGCDDAGWLGCSDASPDDDFRIGRGCQVTVAPGDDILLEQSGAAGLSVGAGGTLSVEGPVEIMLGPQGVTGHPGSTVSLRGCFREFATVAGQCTAALGAAHLFPIGDVVPCRDGDCSDDAEIVRIRYSDAQVDAMPVLASFLASLDAARDVLCFWQTSEDAYVGADSGYCYDIIGVSAAPGDRHLDFDIRQGWAAPSDQAGYPLARRQVQQATLAGVHPAGSRTLRFVEDGLVTHRTDQMGRWVRCDGDQRAYLIATVGDLAGGDTLTLADRRGLARLYPSGTRCHVDWGWSAGDAAFVMAPVHLTSRTHATGDSFALFSGEVALTALVVDGLSGGAPPLSGALALDGAQIQELRHVWVVDPLSPDQAAVRINDVGCGATVEHLIVTGGPPLPDHDKNYGLAWIGGADCTYFLRHLYVRFAADDNLVTDSGGYFPTDRLDWRWIHAGPSSGRGDSGQLFDFGTGNSVDSFGADALCTACTTQDGFGNLVAPSGFGTGDLSRILWVGVFNGAFSLLRYPDYRFSEIGVVGSAIDAANPSGAGALVAPSMEDFYVVDVHDPRSNSMHLCGSYANGPGTGTLRRGIFADLSLGALPCRLGGSDALEDVYFVDVARSGPSGSLVEVVADAAAVSLRRVSMAFRADPIGLREGLRVAPAGASALSLDGLLLSGFRGPQLSSAMALGSVEAAAAVAWGAPVCFWDNDRDEDEAVLAAYGTPPVRGVDPRFVDPERLRFDVDPDGTAAHVGCAARGAGVRRTNWAHRKAKLEPIYMGEPPPAVECSDGIDNDGDGLADLDDRGCSDGFDLDEHAPTLPCDDGVDNDDDGKADYRTSGDGDPGCAGSVSGRENPQCQDGLDNDVLTGIDFDGGASLDLDHDGFVDARFNPAKPPVGAADPQCVDAPWRRKEQAACGLGFEVTLALLPLALARRRAARRQDVEAPADRGVGRSPRAHVLGEHELEGVHRPDSRSARLRARREREVYWGRTRVNRGRLPVLGALTPRKCWWS